MSGLVYPNLATNSLTMDDVDVPNFFNDINWLNIEVEGVSGKAQQFSVIRP